MKHQTDKKNSGMMGKVYIYIKKNLLNLGSDLNGEEAMNQSTLSFLTEYTFLPPFSNNDVKVMNTWASPIEEETASEWSDSLFILFLNFILFFKKKIES